MSDSTQSRSLIIAADFDGGIVEDKYPDIGKPNWKVIALLHRALAAGHRLILNTCRTGEYLRDAEAACGALSLTFAAVNANLPDRIALYGGDSRKISADVYLDDKAFNPHCDTRGPVNVFPREFYDLFSKSDVILKDSSLPCGSAHTTDGVNWDYKTERSR